MIDAIATFHAFSPLTQFLMWIMLFLVVPRLCERLNVPEVLGFILLGWVLRPEAAAPPTVEAKP